MSETPEFITEMMDMNDHIKNDKTVLTELYQKLEETENSIKQLEASEMEIITEETENGKPKYSNADKRGAELKSRLSTNEIYTQLKTSHTEIKKQISSLNIELDHLIRKFDIYKILGKYQTRG